MQLSNTRSMIALGGCINNRTPHDRRVDNCDCYKIRFSICYRFRIYDITMCREWVKYMAEHARKERDLVPGSCRPNWGQVISAEIESYFSDMVRYHKPTRPHSERAKALCGPYGKYPTAFREVVMANKWGYIDHYLSIKEILSEFDEYTVIGCNMYLNDYDKRYENHYWKHFGTDRNASIAIDANRREFNMFQLALYRIYAGRETKFPQSIMHNFDDCMKVATKLLKLKIEEHEANQQQVSAALSV